jgi:hypothetical protein
LSGKFNVIIWVSSAVGAYAWFSSNNVAMAVRVKASFLADASEFVPRGSH